MFNEHFGTSWGLYLVLFLNGGGGGGGVGYSNGTDLIIPSYTDDTSTSIVRCSHTTQSSV